MTTPPLSGLSVLVVDGKNSAGSDLRSALIGLGANVHVVGSVEAGLLFASRKRLHGAILDCLSHGASLRLCAQLAMNHVPFMFYGGIAGRGSDEAADCIAELISLEARRAPQRRQLQFLGSGEDRHQLV